MTQVKHNKNFKYFGIVALPLWLQYRNKIPVPNEFEHKITEKKVFIVKKQKAIWMVMLGRMDIGGELCKLHADIRQYDIQIMYITSRVLKSMRWKSLSWWVATLSRRSHTRSTIFTWEIKSRFEIITYEQLEMHGNLCFHHLNFNSPSIQQIFIRAFSDQIYTTHPKRMIMWTW